EAVFGLQGTRHRGRRQRHPRPGARDRPGQDEGPERQRYRKRDAADRRLRPFDGHHGEGLTAMATSKRFKKASEGVDVNKSYSVEDAVKLVKARATAKFDETIELSLNL